MALPMLVLLAEERWLWMLGCVQNLWYRGEGGMYGGMSSGVKVWCKGLVALNVQLV